MRWRRWCVGLVVGATAATGLVACGDDPAYAHELERFDGASGEENVVVELPDGDRFSVGSPDGQALVVQWYDADSDGWSAPRRVHVDEEHWTHDVRATVRAGTVAVDADYWEERELDDDYAPLLSVGVVCVEGSCTPGAASRPGRLSGVSLASDGEYATFGRGGWRYAVWDGGEGWREERLEPLADRSEGADVRLADDGSFQGLVGRRVEGGCAYTLHTTEPRGFDFTEQVTTTTQPATRSGCWASLDDDGGEVPPTRAAVWVEAISGTVVLERVDGRWVQEGPPPDHRDVADTGGRSTLAPVGDRVEDPRAVLYSPDTRTIWSQTYDQWAGTWDKPREVLTVPEGVACRSGRVERLQHRLVARIACYTDGGGPGGPPDLTAVLLSLNSGTVWNGGLATDAGRVAVGGTGFLVAGRPGMAHLEGDEGPVWSEVALPFPAPGVDPVVLGHDYVLRVAPEAAAGGCRATVWTAGSTEDEEWEETLVLDVPSPGRCPRLEAERVLTPPRGVDSRVLVTTPARPGWRAVLDRVDGGWRASEAPGSGRG